MRKITLLFILFLAAGSLSAQTILDVPTVGTATRPTLTGFTANWTAVPNATSYAINVYDGASALVTGSPKTVTGATSATLAVTAMLQPNSTYTYTVTAIGDAISFLNSAASAPSEAFTTGSSTGTYTLQYAASDVATLLVDLRGGAADIYELTTSGGAYTFTTADANNAILIRNTKVRAAAGLAAKPIIKLNSTTATTNTINIFQTVTPNLTVYFEGLEFDGVNPGASGQPLLFYSNNLGAANTKLYINDCYIRSFKNTSGNGLIQMKDEGSTTQVIDIQNTVINDCGGRIIYLNPAANPTKCDITLKNVTFSNNALLASRANVIYGAKANTGTTLFDHCTFYNLVTTSGSEGIIRYPSGSGVITVSNSIFSTVAQTLPAATISYCYLAGFTGTVPTGTNTFTTVPTFTNAATLDFSLTNKSSFICADTKVAGNTIYYSALPKLDSPVVGTAGSIGTNGFTANWSAVSNASGGYSIKVYEGATLVSTTLAAGQETVSTTISGLKTGTTYTYKVTAVGDATNYDSSEPSAASASFTTLGLAIPVVGSATDIATNSFTANWTPVTNASSYDVMVYLMTNLVSTTNIAGQASSSLAITGLAMGTSYTYKVMAIGDGITYLNSDVSPSSTAAKTLAEIVNQLNPNFGDGSWGTVYTSSQALGSYPTYSANGFDLTKAYVQSINVTGLKGESYTHMLKLDKSSNSGVMDSPTVASVSQLEIRASATTGRQFTLYIWNAGTSTWSLHGTYTTTVDTENIFLINFSGTLTNAKFRIINISSGAFSFYKIKTHTTQPVALTAPTVGAASEIGSFGFTANWTPVDVNGSNYDVKVFLQNHDNLGNLTGAVTLVSTQSTISGQASSSLALTGLQADSTYYYKVVATGDGDNLYSNSLLSAASASFTTLSDVGTSVIDLKSKQLLQVNAKTISASETGSFEVYNLQGVKLLDVSNVNYIETNLLKGLYVVRFTNKVGKQLVQKIIIK
jgi:hypothetical protein